MSTPAWSNGESGGGSGPGPDGEAGRRLLAEATALITALQSSGAGHEGPQCRVCPVCRALALLQRVRPEAVEHLAGAVSDLAVAVREVLAPLPAPPDPAGPGRRAPEPVEHIDISD